MEYAEIQQVAAQLKQDQAAQKEIERQRKIKAEAEQRHQHYVTAQVEFKKTALKEGVKASFKLPTPATPFFKTLIKSLNFIRDDSESTFVLSKDSLDSRMMDPSHVALQEIHVPAGAFEHYFYEGSEEVRFSVLTEDLKRLTSVLDRKDEITCSVSKDTLSLVLSNGLKRVYNLFLVEGSTSDPPLPKLEFIAKASLSRVSLESILRQATATSDQVRVRITAERMTFSNKSDAGKFEATFVKDSAEILEISTPRPQSATYTIEHLSGFLKAVSDTVDVVEFEMSSDRPARLTARMLDPQSDAKVVFWLAPRVGDGKNPDANPPEATKVDKNKTVSPAVAAATAQPG